MPFRVPGERSIEPIPYHLVPRIKQQFVAPAQERIAVSVDSIGGQPVKVLVLTLDRRYKFSTVASRLLPGQGTILLTNHRNQY